MMSIDLEMNQPSGTIIQVGVAIGNVDTGELVHKYSAITHAPFEVISPYIETLTKITQADMEGGIHLRDAYDEVCRLYVQHECQYNVITWGGGDTTVFYEQTKEHRASLADKKAAHIFGRRWLDVKTLFQVREIAQGRKPAAGLRKAMVRSGLRFEGTAHTAGDDAWNTFRLFMKLKEIYLCDI